MKSFVCHESYYNCNDGCSILKATQYNSDGPEPLVEISIYPMFPKYRDWKIQLKWIWQILTKQCVWDDQIILNKEEMEKLGNQLLSLAKEIK